MSTFIIETKDGKVLKRSGLDFNLSEKENSFKTIGKGMRDLDLKLTDVNVILLYLGEIVDVLYMDEEYRQEQIELEQEAMKDQQNIAEQEKEELENLIRDTTIDTIAQILFSASEENGGSMKS